MNKLYALLVLVLILCLPLTSEAESIAASAGGGESCATAVAAVVGINSVPDADADVEFWYSFVMPQDGKLIITSETTVPVFYQLGNCEYLYQSGNKNGNMTIGGLKNGAEILIRWYVAESGPFDWNLAIENNGLGDVCTQAENAVQGENNVPISNNLEYWYSFTMPRDGKILISSEANKSVKVTRDNCDYYDVLNSGTGTIAATGLKVGEQVYIIWETDHEKSINWTLTVADNLEGELCSFPFAALEGDNESPVAQYNVTSWYKFTMPRDGKLVVASEQSIPFYILGGFCENLEWKNYGSGQLSVPGLKEGEVIYLQWESSKNFAFQFNLAIAEDLPGETCSLAITANEGANSLPEGLADYYWYKFTMPKEGKLVISSESGYGVGIFSNKCDNSGYLSYGYGNHGHAGLGEGEEIMIKWANNGESFNWEIAIVDNAEGEVCNLPVEAATGNNLVPFTNLDYYWYSFTMPFHGRLKISSETSNFVSVFGNNCDLLTQKGGGVEDVTVENLAAEEEVLIRWDIHYPESFIWQLVLEEYSEGEICNVAVEAVEGTNTIPVVDFEEFWFRFTMPREGKVVITSESTAHVQVGRGSCESSWWDGAEYQKTVISGLKTGENIWIKWGGIRDKSFDWNLSITDYEEGDLCNTAFVAQEGDNLTPATQGSRWYKFSMPRDGNIKITTSAESEAIVYTGSCEYERLNSLNYYQRINPLIDGIKEGEIIYIEWKNKNGEAFEWNLTVGEDNSSPGTSCNSAVLAVEGENIIEGEGINRSRYWYKFVMPKDGRLHVTSPTNNSVYFSKGKDCGSLEYLSFASSSKIASGLKEGEIIYINWSLYDENTFKWSLAIEDNQPGDYCAIAHAAVEGVNIIPQTKSDQWFSFTMPKDGQLRISSEYNGNVNFHKDCEDFSIFESSYGNALLPGLKAGETVYIQWVTNWNIVEGWMTAWNLAVEDNEAGNICNLALTAMEGENTLPSSYSDVWYKFTMPRDGRIRVKTASFLNTYIIRGSCEEGETINHHHEETIGGGLLAGETVFIRFHDSSGSSMKWNLTVEDNEPGDYCGLAHPLVEGNNKIPYTNSREWFQFKVPREGVLAFRFKGNQNYSIMSGDCENLIYRNYSWEKMLVPDVKEGETIYFTLYHWEEKGLDFTLSIEDFEGADCATPLTAQVGDNSVSATYLSEQWYSFVMPIEGGLSLSSTENAQLNLYEGSCEVLNLHTTGIGSITAKGLTQNTTYWIKAEAFSGKGYNFNLKIDGLKENQTITFDEVIDPIVSSGSVELSASSTSGLPVNFEVVAGSATVSGTTLSFVTAGEVTVEARQAGDATFEAAESVRQTFCIKPDQAVVTIENGEEPKEGATLVSSSAAGNQWFRNGVAIDGAVSQTYQTSVSGLYSVQVTTGGCVGLVSDEIQIGKLDQSISFAEVNGKALSIGSVTLSATATSELPVTFVLISGPATLSGSTLIFNSVGEVTVETQQEGNSLYHPATPVRQTFCINPDKPVLSIENGAEARVGVTLVSDRPEGNQWFKDGQRIESATGQIFLASEAGIYTSRVTVNSCTSEVSEGIEIKKFEQTISFESIGDKTFFDAQLVLQASASSDLPIRFEVISGPASLSGNTLTFNSPGTVTVKANQEGNSSFEAANPIEQTFCIKPDTPVITVVDGAELIVGVKLQSSSSTGNQWFKDGIKLEGAVNQSYQPTKAGVYTVQLHEGGCSSAVSEGVQVKKASQTISSPPPVEEIVEVGKLVELAAVASSGLPVRFEVESGPAQIEDGKLIFSGAGPVTLVAYQDGDEAYETAASVKITFCVLPAKPSIQVENQVSARVGARLVSSSSEGNQWFRNGIKIEGATEPSYEATEEGAYTVKVNVGGCVGPESEVVMITGLSDKPFTQALKAYPNPTDSKVRIEFVSKQGSDKIRIVVVNGNGVEVAHPYVLKMDQANPVLELDLTKLSSGLYHVLISDGESITKAKILKN